MDREETRALVKRLHDWDYTKVHIDKEVIEQAFRTRLERAKIKRPYTLRN